MKLNSCHLQSGIKYQSVGTSWKPKSGNTCSKSKCKMQQLPHPNCTCSPLVMNSQPRNWQASNSKCNNNTNTNRRANLKRMMNNRLTLLKKKRSRSSSNCSRQSQRLRHLSTLLKKFRKKKSQWIWRKNKHRRRKLKLLPNPERKFKLRTCRGPLKPRCVKTTTPPSCFNRCAATRTSKQKNSKIYFCKPTSAREKSC